MIFSRMPHLNYTKLRWNDDVYLKFSFLTSKGLSEKNAESITSTTVSQFGTNSKIKFLIVNQNRWRTLIFRTNISLPGNQTPKKS